MKLIISLKAPFGNVLSHKDSGVARSSVCPDHWEEQIKGGCCFWSASTSGLVFYHGRCISIRRVPRGISSPRSSKRDPLKICAKKSRKTTTPARVASCISFWNLKQLFQLQLNARTWTNTFWEHRATPTLVSNSWHGYSVLIDVMWSRGIMIALI